MSTRASPKLRKHTIVCAFVTLEKNEDLLGVSYLLPSIPALRTIIVDVRAECASRPF